MTIASLISVVLLAAVLWQVDFFKLAIIAKNLKPSFFLLALITLPLEIFLKAVRLKVMTETQSKITFTNSLVVTLIGLPLGMVTPGRFGDFIKLDALSRRTSLPLMKSFSVGVMEKILDFFSLLALTFTGIIVLVIKGREEKIFFCIIFFVIAMAVFVAAVLNRNLTEKIFKYFLEKLGPAGLKSQVEDYLAGFYSGISAIAGKNKALSSSLLLAFLLWFNRILRIFFVALSLGLKIRLEYLFLIVPVIDVVEIMPLSIMGLGTREYAYIFLLSLIGISREESLALSLLAFLLVAVSFSFAGYLAIMKEYGKSFKEKLVVGNK